MNSSCNNELTGAMTPTTMSETDHILVRSKSSSVESPTHQNSVSDVEIRVYKRRFFVLAIYCLGMFMGAFCFIQYTVIADLMVDYYSVSSMMINLTSIVFTAGFIVAMIPTIWIFENWGLKNALVLGLALNAIGLAIKCVGLDPGLFSAALVGQTFLAVGQCFFLTTSPHIAAVWFGADEVSRATASGVFFNSFGVAAAAVISPYVVNGGTRAIVQNQLSYMMYAETGVAFVGVLLAVFFVEHEPPHPPSKAQAMVLLGANRRQSDLMANIRSIVSNKNFILLATSFSISYAVIFSFATVFNQMLLGIFPGSNKDVGLMVLLLQITCLLGTVVAGVLLDKTHKYKLISVTGYLLGIISVAIFTYVLYTKLVFVYIGVALVGFFVGGFLTVGLDLGAEMSYPISEVCSLGVAGIIANIVTLVLMFSCGLLLDAYGALPTNLLLLSSTLIGFVCLVAAKMELHRFTASQVSINQFT